MSNKLKNKLKKVIKEQLYDPLAGIDAQGALIDPDRINRDKTVQPNYINFGAQGNTWRIIEEPTISSLSGPPTDFESAECP
jgi:hypothetical protein